MSAVTTITKLAAEVVARTARAITHPADAVAAATAKVRGVAASAPTEPETDTDLLPFPAAPDIEPVAPQEPAHTEPKAASREAAHSGRGTEPTDDWRDELDDGPEVKTSAGTTGVAPEVNPATGLPHQQHEG